MTITYLPSAPGPAKIAKVVRENKVPFYGFHTSPVPFFKISVVNPRDVKAIAALLQQVRLRYPLVHVYLNI